MTSVPGIVLRIIVGAIGAFAVTILGAVVVPFVIGYRASVIVTGSMVPHINVGDTVVGHRVPPDDIAVGDVIIFMDPERSDRELAHRVIAAIGVDEGVRFTAKGDANTTVERFTIAGDSTVGLVSYRIPKAGFAFLLLRSPLARILFVAVPALALMTFELVRLWRPARVGSDA